MFRRLAVYTLFFMAAFAACNRPSGAVSVQLVVPTGEHCTYQITPTTIETLDDLFEMRGKVGHVVSSLDQVIESSEMLMTGHGLSPVPTRFSFSGGTYWPLDYSTLMSASLYYSIEKSYKEIARIDPAADLARFVNGFSETRIVQEARRTFSEGGHGADEERDNAEYYSQVLGENPRQVLNYFFSFPTETVRNMPLGLNLGIMAHEYTHMVFTHLFYEPATVLGMNHSDDPTRAGISSRTLGAVDEGIADYFGFLVTKDPGFFECSFPAENRTLSVPKYLTQNMADSIRDGGAVYDSHEGGAVWASANYEIGRQIGFDNAARTLIQFMATLKNCPAVREGGDRLYFTFSSMAECHAQAAGSYSGTVSSIYSRYFAGVRQ